MTSMLCREKCFWFPPLGFLYPCKGSLRSASMWTEEIDLAVCCESSRCDATRKTRTQGRTARLSSTMGGSAPSRQVVPYCFPTHCMMSFERSTKRYLNSIFKKSPVFLIAFLLKVVTTIFWTAYACSCSVFEGMAPAVSSVPYSHYFRRLSYGIPCSEIRARFLLLWILQLHEFQYCWFLSIQIWISVHFLEFIDFDRELDSAR